MNNSPHKTQYSECSIEEVTLIKFECGNCDQKVSASRDMVGTSYCCPNCNDTLVVPDVEPKQIAGTQSGSIMQNRPGKWAAMGLVVVIISVIGAIAYSINHSHNENDPSGSKDSTTVGNNGADRDLIEVTGEDGVFTVPEGQSADEYFNLAHALENKFVKTGTPNSDNDLGKAIKLYQKASEMGNSHAAFRLSICYSYDSSYQDKTNANFARQIAALNDFAPAQIAHGLKELSLLDEVYQRVDELSSEQLISIEDRKMTAMMWVELGKIGFRNLSPKMHQEYFEYFLNIPDNYDGLYNRMSIYGKKKLSYKVYQWRLKEDTQAAGDDKRFYQNSLGMYFSEVPIYPEKLMNGKKLYFSVWETRLKDYLEYVNKTGTSYTWGPKLKESYQRYIQHEDLPIVFVSPEEAEKFCEWLTQKELTEGRIPDGARYRLPTDHEWSCAVGIGKLENHEATAESKIGEIKHVYPWGVYYDGELYVPMNEGNLNIRNVEHDFADYAPVGNYRAGYFSLFDMAGNVSELVTDPNETRDVLFISRGSSFMDLAYESDGKFLKGKVDGLYSSHRTIVADSEKIPDGLLTSKCIDVGFRCVLELPDDLSDISLSVVGPQEIDSIKRLKIAPVLGQENTEKSDAEKLGETDNKVNAALSVTTGFKKFGVFRSGFPAYSNRSYKWIDVPKDMPFSQYSLVLGGGKDPLKGRVTNSGWVYIAVSDEVAKPDIDRMLKNGWVKTHFQFAYKAQRKTRMFVYKKQFKVGDFEIKRMHWSGPILLIPTATQLNLKGQVWTWGSDREKTITFIDSSQIRHVQQTWSYQVQDERTITYTTPTGYRGTIRFNDEMTSFEVQEFSPNGVRSKLPTQNRVR